MATPPPYTDITGLYIQSNKHVDSTLENYNGNARPGQLIVDTDNYSLYIGNADGNLNPVTGGGGNGSPGGFNTQIQFNDGGSFGGNTGFTYNKVTGTLTAPLIAGAGNGLSNIQGANVSGTVGLATVAATANAVAGANVTGFVANANVANTALAVAGANVSGFVANANVANTALAVAGANVSGVVANASFATLAATANAVAGANVTGFVANANVANTALAVAGANVTGFVANANVANTALAVAGANVSGFVANANVANTAATVTTAAQPSITSVGTLTSLTLSGNLTSNANVGFTGANVSLGAVGNLQITGGSNGQVLTSNGSGGLSFTTVTGGTSTPISLTFGNTLPANSSGNNGDIFALTNLEIDVPFQGYQKVANAWANNNVISYLAASQASDIVDQATLSGLADVSIDGGFEVSTVLQNIIANSTPTVTLDISQSYFVVNLANVSVPDRGTIQTLLKPGVYFTGEGGPGQTWSMTIDEIGQGSGSVFEWGGRVVGTQLTPSMANFANIAGSVTNGVIITNSTANVVATSVYYYQPANGILYYSPNAYQSASTQGGWTVSGNLEFDDSTNTLSTTNLVTTSANLGAVANVKILGGSNGQVLTTNGSNVLSWTTVTGTAANPAGSNTQIQFNANGAFGANSGLTYDAPNRALQVGNLGFQSWSSGNLNYNIIHSNGNPSGFRMNSNRMGIGILDSAGTFASGTVGVQIIAANNAAGDASTVTFAAFGPADTSNYTVRIRSTDNVGGIGNIRMSGNLVTDDHSFFSNIANLHIGNGSNGQFLQTNGSGNLTWANAVTAAAGSNTQLQFNNAGAFGSSANLTFVDDTGTSTTTLTVAGSLGLAKTPLGDAVVGNSLSVLSQTGNLAVTSANNITVTATAGNLTLPTVAKVKMAGGSNLQFLQTDGSGNLTWANATAPAGSNTQLQFNANGAFAASGNLSFIDAANVNGNANLQLQFLTIGGRGDITSNGTGISLTATGTGGQSIDLNGAASNNNPVNPGGDVSLSGGSANGTSVSAGTINIEAGQALGATANGGDIYIAAGSSEGGAPGIVDIYSGEDSNGAFGNINIVGNVQLGAVANVHITGGSNLQFLQTNGSGNLTWAAIPIASSIANGNSNVSIASVSGNVTMTANNSANLTFDTTGNLTVPSSVIANAVFTKLTNTTVSANATVAQQITFVSAAANVTITMPAASANTVGQVYYIKDVLGTNRTGNTITIVGDSGQLIDGGNVQIISPYNSATIVGVTATSWGVL